MDVSGSFRRGGHFDDAVDFAALYIYAHMKGFKDLRRPTDVFVGTMGGQKVGEAKTFHPIQDLSGKSPSQIAASLRAWFPEEDPITDYNAFFERVAVHVQRQNLGLAPLSIVMFSDGVPDIPGAKGDELYRRINMTPLEYLSRSVTVRLLYASPKVAQRWEKHVPRKRVKLWTQDHEAPSLCVEWPAGTAGFPLVLDEERGRLSGSPGESDLIRPPGPAARTRRR
jgi:hypothetical protein